jgi:hypothetical protein
MRRCFVFYCCVARRSACTCTRTLVTCCLQTASGVLFPLWRRHSLAEQRGAGKDEDHGHCARHYDAGLCPAGKGSQTRAVFEALLAHASRRHKGKKLVHDVPRLPPGSLLLCRHCSLSWALLVPCALARVRLLDACTRIRKTQGAGQVLKDKDEVVLCCIRKRSNDAPRLHALVPQTEVREGRDILAPEGFHVVPLPFADDIRNLPPGFSISKEDEPDEDAVELAAKLVKRVKNERVLRRLECALDLVNPSLLKQFAHVEAHALGVSFPLHALHTDDNHANLPSPCP